MAAPWLTTKLVSVDSAKAKSTKLVQHVRRRNTLLQIPAFSYNYDAARTYSYILADFCYEATNPFHLQSLPRKPVSPNFVPCIRWRNGSTGFRRAFWLGVGEQIWGLELFEINTVIPKNFVIEIWSTTTPSVVSSGVIEIPVSFIKDITMPAEDFSDYIILKDPTVGDDELFHSLPMAVPTSFHLTNHWKDNA